MLLAIFSPHGNTSASTTSATAFTTVDTTSPMSKGTKGAKVALIQYSDFLCPSCAYFSTQIMPKIDDTYIKTGKINFEFRPMAFVAPGSTLADEGAYCAVDQAKFWDYHDAMYNYVWTNAFSKGIDPTTTTILTADIIKQIAPTAGLDTASFNSCLDSGQYAAKVAKATSDAQSLDVVSTPYIMVNGQHFQGNVSYDTIAALIKAGL